ncbi:MAG: DUF4335 domain-containing protein [Cyanobacteria bacterium J06638_28]
MTTQRQYILPNCSLIVEGLVAGDESDITAPLTVVLNTECQFPGIAESLQGGREFLDALIQAVSIYAQTVLSGVVTQPTARSTATLAPVTLTLSEENRHTLAADVTDANGEVTRRTVILNAVQLFDLTEAVDQLLSDSLTLPDVSLQVVPLQRRYIRPAEPMAQRVVPAATGLSALAASAALLFMVPVPEEALERIRETEDEAALVEEAPTTADGAPEPTTDGLETEPSITDDAESDAAPTDDAAVDESVDESTTEPALADPLSAATALTRLRRAPEITNVDDLEELQANLESTLAAALPETLDFEESLTYRVAVAEDGDLLGYKYEDDVALTNVDSTPLPELTFIPVNLEQQAEEPVAQFWVTFEPDGEVTAEPIE